MSVGKASTMERTQADRQQTPVPGSATNSIWDPMTPFYKIK